MRQRVAIAIALLHRPDLIIADEPTTALDVTIQAQILYEMQKLARESGTALIWITHDLAVVAGLADRIAVMYAGRIVESGGRRRGARRAVASLYARPDRFGAGRGRRGEPLRADSGHDAVAARTRRPAAPSAPRCSRSRRDACARTPGAVSRGRAAQARCLPLPVERRRPR